LYVIFYFDLVTPPPHCLGCFAPPRLGFASAARSSAEQSFAEEHSPSFSVQKKGFLLLADSFIFSILHRKQKVKGLKRKKKPSFFPPAFFYLTFYFITS
jgi:hypothetical protein